MCLAIMGLIHGLASEQCLALSSAQAVQAASLPVSVAAHVWQYSHKFLWACRPQLVVSCVMMLFQQFTGINAVCPLCMLGALLAEGTCPQTHSSAFCRAAC